jgi:hypothetical protein
MVQAQSDNYELLSAVELLQNQGKKKKKKLLQKVIGKNRHLLVQLRAGQTGLAFMQILYYDWKLRVKRAKKMVRQDL